MTKTLREKKVYIAPAHVERQRTAARNTVAEPRVTTTENRKREVCTLGHTKNLFKKKSSRKSWKNSFTSAHLRVCDRCNNVFDEPKINRRRKEQIVTISCLPRIARQRRAKVVFAHAHCRRETQNQSWNLQRTKQKSHTAQPTATKQSSKPFGRTTCPHGNVNAAIFVVATANEVSNKNNII